MCDNKSSGRETLIQLVKFGFVGAFNTLVGYALYLIGLTVGMSPEISLAVATALGAVFNYYTTARLVFSYKTSSKLVLFVLTYGVIYIANVTALRLLIALGLTASIAQLVILPAVALFSFAIFRWFVFSERQ